MSGDVDAVRCPECDFALMMAPARRVSLVIGQLPNPAKVLDAIADTIYCDRCDWWKLATADDIGVLEMLRARI